jgi:hypothetical protein
MTCECRGRAAWLEGANTCLQEAGARTAEYIAQCEAVLCEICCIRSAEVGLCCACGAAIDDAHFRPLPAEVIA